MLKFSLGGGCLFNAERDLPHLISVCNRTVVTSDDNTEVTNNCDLIKRDRRRPPADWRHSKHRKQTWLGLSLIYLILVFRLPEEEIYGEFLGLLLHPGR